jgi:hypothetical protein
MTGETMTLDDVEKIQARWDAEAAAKEKVKDKIKKKDKEKKESKGLVGTYKVMNEGAQRQLDALNE